MTMDQVPALIKNLQNVDPMVRLKTVASFAQIGFIAVQSLHNLNAQHDLNISSQSLSALSELSNDAIQLMLEPMAQTRNGVYLETIEAFQDILDVVLSALSYTLHDDHWEVRHRSMEALWQMATPEAIEALNGWDEGSTQPIG